MRAEWRVSICLRGGDLFQKDLRGKSRTNSRARVREAQTITVTLVTGEKGEKKEHTGGLAADRERLKSRRDASGNVSWKKYQRDSKKEKAWRGLRLPQDLQSVGAENTGGESKGPGTASWRGRDENNVAHKTPALAKEPPAQVGGSGSLAEKKVGSGHSRVQEQKRGKQDGGE